MRDMNIETFYGVFDSYIYLRDIFIQVLDIYKENRKAILSQVSFRILNSKFNYKQLRVCSNIEFLSEPLVLKNNTTIIMVCLDFKIWCHPLHKLILHEDIFTNKTSQFLYK